MTGTMRTPSAVSQKACAPDQGSDLGVRCVLCCFCRQPVIQLVVCACAAPSTCFSSWVDSKQTQMDATPGVAKFDLETPTKAYAADAATQHFAPVELADNLATISLDSEVHPPAPPNPAASGAAPAAEVTEQAPAAPAAPTSHSEGVVTAAAPPAATLSQPPPELPSASPVKVRAALVTASRLPVNTPARATQCPAPHAVCRCG